MTRPSRVSCASEISPRMFAGLISGNVRAMKKASEPKKPSTQSSEIELHPDAWERFGEFVKRIARAGPQHRKPKQQAQAKPEPLGLGYEFLERRYRPAE